MRAIVFFFCCAQFVGLCAKEILPHRAKYVLEVVEINPKSDLSSVKGTMDFEILKTPNNWQISQKTLTSMVPKRGRAEILTAHYIALESFDGKNLKFEAKRSVNLQPLEHIKGVADFSKKAEQVNFTAPEKQIVTLQGLAIPPIAHIRHLLESAANNKKLINEKVFDGSSMGSEVTISTFIGKKKKACKALLSKGVDENMHTMNLAIYEGDESPTPAFEMTEELSESGVMCGYKMKFKDYTVKATLKELQVYK